MCSTEIFYLSIKISLTLYKIPIQRDESTKEVLLQAQKLWLRITEVTVQNEELGTKNRTCQDQASGITRQVGDFLLLYQAPKAGGYWGLLRVCSILGCRDTEIRLTPPYSVQNHKEWWQGFWKWAVERFTKLVILPNKTKQITEWKCPAGSKRHYVVLTL